MKYVALLRGINVGGRRNVSMASLKDIFAELGFKNVKTYINSGNVIFETGAKDRPRLTRRIEKALLDALNVEISVLLRDAEEIDKLAGEIPDSWVKDSEARCNVVFLWSEVDSPQVLESLPLNPEVDDVRYVAGAVLWRVPRALATRSRMNRLTGTPIYQQITVRNANTTRALHRLMQP